jgi:membrane protein
MIGGGEPASRSIKTVAGIVWRHALTDRAMLTAGGLALFSIFAILPAIAALALLAQMLVGEDALESRFEKWAARLPEGTDTLLREFFTVVPRELGLGVGLLLNLLIVFWTIQRSASGIITALNMVHEVDEKRSRWKREAVAIGIAVSTLIFLFVSLYLIVLAPLVIEGMEGWHQDAIGFVRWPLLAALFFLYLGGLYRFAPAEAPGKLGWISIGTGVAMLIWLVGTALFALYLDALGGFDEFYGSAASLMVLLAWLFITSFCVLVGAEVNEQLAAMHEKHSELESNSGNKPAETN